MKIQIKHRYTDAALFECDVPDNIESGMAVRHALENAVDAGANLAGANLAGANLACADLYGANLAGANLAGANLACADLYGADLAGAKLDGANLACASLYGADLYGADLAGAKLDGAKLDGANLAGAKLDGASLYGADLYGADLAGAKLDGAKLYGKILQGERPVFQIGPIGSRCAYLVSYLTDSGIVIKAGCFTGTLDEFVQKVSNQHGDSVHAKEYLAAVDLIKTHAQLWEATKS